MTTVLERPPGALPAPEPQPRGVVPWLSTTDHKRIGLLYLGTAFVFFLFGGALAVLMRTELAESGLQVMSTQRYNEAFTVHGTVMMFLFATPMAAGLANYLIPLQVGAPDMAFPRLNALSYWLFLAGGLVILSGFATATGPAAFGWTGYAPLSGAVYSPGPGPDLWIVGLVLTGVSTVLTAVNVLTTVITLRTPGLTMFRMPLFAWTWVATSFLVLLSFPVITSALAMLFADRRLGAHFFDPTSGGSALLWEHLFWFFGHPEVYIIALPFFGVVSEVIPVFSGRPLFGYVAFVLATMAITAYSVTTWAHHMFTTGAINGAFFAGTTILIAVPTGVKVFNWLFTMIGGHIRLTTAMLFAVGFIVVFVVGGLTGPMLAVPSFDYEVHDTYFVVAHMHYVLLGTAVFAMFAGLYFWWPKFFGYRLSERWGVAHFVLMFVGANLTFFPQHLLGLRGMPRRYADYPDGVGYDGPHLLSSLGAGLQAVAVVLFLVNIVVSRRRRVPAGPDPWGGNSLEWLADSPPPPHNFAWLPPVRSERPAHDERLAAAGRAEG